MTFDAMADALEAWAGSHDHVVEKHEVGLLCEAADQLRTLTNALEAEREKVARVRTLCGIKINGIGRLSARRVLAALDGEESK
jgi:hypothetical protein